MTRTNHLVGTGRDLGGTLAFAKALTVSVQLLTLQSDFVLANWSGILIGEMIAIHQLTVMAAVPAVVLPIVTLALHLLMVRVDGIDTPTAMHQLLAGVLEEVTEQEIGCRTLVGPHNTSHCIDPVRAANLYTIHQMCRGRSASRRLETRGFAKV